MKGKKQTAAALGLVLLLALTSPAYAMEADALVPMGSTVGIRLETDGVTVVGLTDVETADGPVCPAEAAGLRSGDVITQVGGRATHTAADFLTAVTELDGREVSVTARRNGKQVMFRISPALGEDGACRLGLWLRDGVSGIGTVTFYDPASGTFGALGHGINDLDSGELLPFDGGSITSSTVVDVVRGEAGTPGELCGRFDRDAVLGTLSRNTAGGIFGTAEFSGCGEPIPVAGESEVKLGPATILSNVSGEDVEEFSVEISRIYRAADDNRFLLLTVTDPELIGRTGGIVQGMSGSPILQDGKLIGAVTHVLLSDPTRGYGISMEDMLAAAG